VTGGLSPDKSVSRHLPTGTAPDAVPGYRRLSSRSSPASRNPHAPLAQSVAVEALLFGACS
jgi:hypothetical protein